MGLDNGIDAALRADQDNTKFTTGIAEDALKKQEATGIVVSDHCTVNVGDGSPTKHSSSGGRCTRKTKLILAVLAAVVIIGAALGVGLAMGLPKKSSKGAAASPTQAPRQSELSQTGKGLSGGVQQGAGLQPSANASSTKPPSRSSSEPLRLSIDGKSCNDTTALWSLSGQQNGLWGMPHAGPAEAFATEWRSFALELAPKSGPVTVKPDPQLGMTRGWAAVVDLTNHDLYCPPGQAMTSFKVDTRNNTPAADMRVEYGCSTLSAPPGAAAAVGNVTKEPAALGSVIKKQTAPADWQRGRSMALSKHNVTCGDGFLLTRWHLVWSTNTQFFIEYECIRAALGDAGQLQCRWDFTPSGPDGAGMATFLDRHNVQCPLGTALQAWMMQTSNPESESPNEFRFLYNCCGSSHA